MATIFDVAKYILQKKGLMSPWKLQSLCYYAQAWTLVWDARELFPEDFQAWRCGTVCPQLHDLFLEETDHGAREKYIVGPEDMKLGMSETLKDNEVENINTVLREYGDKEPSWLREQVCSEAPWKNARGTLDALEESQEIISKDSMGEFYGSL